MAACALFGVDRCVVLRRAPLVNPLCLPPRSRTFAPLSISDQCLGQASLGAHATWPRLVLAAWFGLSFALFSHQSLDLRPALREEVLVLE